MNDSKPIFRQITVYFCIFFKLTYSIMSMQVYLCKPKTKAATINTFKGKGLDVNFDSFSQ